MAQSTRVLHQQPTEETFEKFLSSSLGEVKPDPGFVGHLRQQLVRKPEVTLERRDWMAASALVGAGLFGGALLFWVIAQLFKGVRVLVFKK